MGLEININDMSLIYGAFIAIFVALWGMKKAIDLYSH
jgi:hypothetical protein